jgi:hypothetical protein
MEDSIDSLLENSKSEIVKTFSTQTLCVENEELPAVKRTYLMFLT